MTTQLTVHALGQLTILFNNRPLTGLSSRTAEAMLIYLMCHERPLSRQVLADFFWDDRPPDRAAANLRTLLTMMRKALGDYLLIDRYSVGFDHERDYWLDVTDLEKRLAELEKIIQSPTPLTVAEAAALQTAVDLYQGNFLAGFYLTESRGFDEWMTLTQERLRHRVETGLRRLVSHCLENGLYEMGRTYAARLLALDPYYEAAHRQMMWLLTRSGQRNAALDHYHACRRLLVDELGVEPSPATTAVFNQIHALDLPPPCHLPRQATPFLGRQTEVTAISHQLSRSDCRLLSLLGPGGTGKTRLAVEVAAHLWQQRPGQFLHGFYFMPLETVESVRELPLLLAEKLNVPLQGPADPLDQLLTYLGDKEVLLILDNVEHLLQKNQAKVARLLARLLEETPQVKLLITSRHRLHLRDEWLFDLTGLDYPPESEAAAAEQYGAPRLFLHHAHRVRRDFIPTVTDWQAITRLCHLLAGLPLGLELAAAWMRQASCGEIVSRLEQSPELLATTYHDTPQRHRSLTAVFNYSWQLLTADERQIFARLSIFRGGFTPAAATAVVQADTAMLAGLADKSLLYRDETNGRFQMHPLLRQFAADHLTDDQPIVADRHADFYLNLLVESGNQKRERLTILPEQRTLILAELPNIRAAWNWAVAQQNYAALDRALVTLHDFYSIQSWFQEGIDTFQAALEQLADLPVKDALQAQVLCELWGRQARMHIQVGQLVPARRLLVEAQRHLTHVTDPDRRSAILLYMALGHYYAGDFEQAMVLSEESLQLAEASGKQVQMASAYNFLGSCAKALGNYDQAQHYFQRALANYRQVDEIMGGAMALNNLGNLAQATGDFAAAQAYYEECSQIFKAHNHLHGAATTLFNAGRLAARQGSHAEARQLLQESLLLKQEIKDERGTAVSLAGLSEVSLATEAYDQARQELTQALTLAHQLDEVKLTVEIVAGFGMLALSEGDVKTAARLLLFIDQHQATAQEIRQRIEPALTSLTDEALLHEARQWAEIQPLDILVAQLLA